MAIHQYLAMTAAEVRSAPALPEGLAWMACHFSPYGLGLSALPRALPPGSLLVVDDITPIHSHDPRRVLEQLEERAQALALSGVLLDFQRPGYGPAAELAEVLTQGLPCPVGVSEPYAGEAGGAVFLPPVGLSERLEARLAPWAGREIWLEETALGETLTLTTEGAACAPLSPAEFPEAGFLEEALRCHYQIQVGKNRAVFRLWRTEEDRAALLSAAENLGVTRTVGLYQQFRAAQA